MRGSYILAVVAAVLVLALGVFLIGRDGTDAPQSDVLTTPTEESASLPLNTATNTDEILEEPILEEGDASTTPLVSDLEEVQDEAIVTYTDAGFSPKTIEITQGDKVTFINNSNRNMWVASNIHPTHNEYPEESDEDCLGSSFDACRGVPTGQSWSFVFNRIGEWGYHDHLNASRTGIVIVE